MLPQVEALEKKYGRKVKFAKVNIQENRRLAISQEVLGLPAVYFYREGEKAAELAGRVTPEMIEAELEKMAEPEMAETV